MNTLDERLKFMAGGDDCLIRLALVEIESLRQKLAHRDAQIVMLREALTVAEEFINRHTESWYLSGQRDLATVRKALAATADPVGVIPCHAEPFAWVGMSGHGAFVTFERPKIQPDLFEQCYRAWEPK